MAPSPVISVFTAAHGAGDGILVPHNSMVAQSEESWEWVIVEDSGSDASVDRIAALASAPEARGRIRLERREGTGSIGASKRAAADLCRADVLVELDHDDELHPNALASVRSAFDSRPEVDFLHSDWIDRVVGAGEPAEARALYSDGWAFGLGAYASEVIGGVRVPVALAPALTWETVRHITSMPNHLRAWRAAFYRAIGGHDPDLPVADDYDLLVRTFLAGRIGRLRLPLYVQRHDRGGTSASRARNAEIQALVEEIAESSRTEIEERCLELGAIPAPAEPLTSSEPIADASIRIDPEAEMRELAGTPLISVIVATHRRPELLHRALRSIFEQTYETFEVLLVGDGCPAVDDVAGAIEDPRLRHWNLDRNHGDSGAAPRNYALKAMARGELVAYLDDDNAWAPEHLASLVGLLEDPAVSYAFSSIEIGGEEIICDRPRLLLIDTSALMHRRALLERYGYWKPPTAAENAHDWELVSRWNRERWAASGLATLRYTLDPERHSPALLPAMRAAADGTASRPDAPA